MALASRCQTPEATYEIAIKPNTVTVDVYIPFKLHLTETDAEDLEANLHNAVEQVLAKYFDMP